MPTETTPIPTVAAVNAAAGPTALERPAGIRWLALVALMVTSFTLVTAEFLPSGILTEMAADLGVTPGQAGQSVTATAVVGFLVAPTISILTPGIDRRTLLVWLTVMAAASNLIVAISPNLVLLLVARFLLGAALSGFWAMSLTITAKLTGPERLGRGMMLVNAGTSMATVAGVPIGVVVSSAFDWRVAFIAAAVVSIVVALALRLLLPRVEAAKAQSLRLLGDTLRRPALGVGLAGHVLIVLGHITAYTFIRLALGRVDGLDEGGAAFMLVAFGIGGLVGTFVIGMLVDRYLSVLRSVVPALIAVSVLMLALMSSSLVLVAIAVFAWGIGFGAWLLTVTTWIGRQAPDRLEAGGGLVVAGFQGAIALGAGVGGLLVDLLGIFPTLLVAVGALIVGGAMFGSAGRGGRRRR
ncbi:MFS transporter [Pseudoclavibacter endophyticus]|uniref:MFS transporter n=1 Tax=Pseudoclavibacter endophyticus TaxID=1778590 RepID=A0A6H9WN54_9MICO|nr:MFS transporter [Pseudoclavibacter endophyticus]KAB1648188.1 MFS transporter [Pseudoclavibacter endophyticus]GGA70500.1 MFS transporter [Pseudoclavibacter endophyticus]